MTGFDGVPLLSGRGTAPDQVGIVVPKLEDAFVAYGMDIDWRCWTYGPDTLQRLEFRGGPGRFRMRIALSQTVPQLELIESEQGPNVYEEWAELHGYGLHHLGYFVESLEAVTVEMASAGIEVLQAGYGLGSDGSGGFVYFDTHAILGYIVEAIRPPARRREPEAVWPAEGERSAT